MMRPFAFFLAGVAIAAALTLIPALLAVRELAHTLNPLTLPPEKGITMSRFYMTGVNSRGNTVSAAGPSRGQDVHLRGWNAGVEVDAFPGDDGRDRFAVYMTHGSNDAGSRKYLGAVMDTPDGPEFIPAK
jgi:hypothetical protein